MAEIPSLQGFPNRWGGAGAALFVVLLAVAVYAFPEHNVAKQLAAQSDATASVLNTTRDQVSVLSARLDAMSAEQAAQKTTALPGDPYREPLTAASSRHRIDDSHWKKIQRQVDNQGKQIDSTRQDLTNARAEFQSSIATTHDELVALEKKGERNYYEFDLDKSSHFQREGPVGVRVRKADTKHNYADLDMLVDDFKVSNKHVNLNQSVVVYSRKSKVPMELVINNVSKNHVHGYLSEPKYPTDEMEAKVDASANNPAAGTNGAQTGSATKPSPAGQPVESPSKN